MSAMHNYTERERYIKSILDMNADQLKKFDRYFKAFEESLIPIDDEPTTEDDIKAIEQARKELNNGETVPYKKVFGDLK
jgi:hypothetical protein